MGTRNDCLNEFVPRTCMYAVRDTENHEIQYWNEATWKSRPVVSCPPCPLSGRSIPSYFVLCQNLQFEPNRLIDAADWNTVNCIYLKINRDSIWFKIFFTFFIFRACCSRRAASCPRAMTVCSAQSRSANIRTGNRKQYLSVITRYGARPIYIGK